MPQLLGLIFDLDGTLVDSVADIRQALNAAIALYRRRPLSMDEVKSIIGDGPRVLLERAFAATGSPLTSDQMQPLLQSFLQLLQTQQATPEMLYPQVKEKLVAFRHKGVKISLCTNKMYAPTVKLLSDIGITDLFDFVAGSDTFPVYKPDPGHVLGVAKGMGVAPQNCVMIGDSSNDIRAAQAAKITSIAVGHGYGRAVGDLGADAVIGGFTELPEALRRLGFNVVG